MANEDFIVHDPTEIVTFNFNVDCWFQHREHESQLLLSKTQRIDFSWPAPFCAYKLFLCGDLGSLGNEPTFSHTDISTISVCNLPLHSLAVGIKKQPNPPDTWTYFTQVSPSRVLWL
jgi:hypothetical protein